MTTKQEIDALLDKMFDRRTRIAAKLEDAGVLYADGIDWLREHEQDTIAYITLFDQWCQQVLDDSYEAQEATA